MKNGEYAVEEKKVATDREYTVWEILQGNLKVWWLIGSNKQAKRLAFPFAISDKFLNSFKM